VRWNKAGLSTSKQNLNHQSLTSSPKFKASPCCQNEYSQPPLPFSLPSCPPFHPARLCQLWRTLIIDRRSTRPSLRFCRGTMGAQRAVHIRSRRQLVPSERITASSQPSTPGRGTARCLTSAAQLKDGVISDENLGACSSQEVWSLSNIANMVAGEEKCLVCCVRWAQAQEDVEALHSSDQCTIVHTPLCRDVSPCQGKKLNNGKTTHIGSIRL